MPAAGAWIGALVLLSACIQSTSSFSLHPQAARLPAPPASSSGKCSVSALSMMDRRAALLGAASLAISSPLAASATPVRAPLPMGKPDPADREKLEKAAKVLSEELGPLIKSGKEGLPKAAEIVNKEPFTQDSMDMMFKRAAMNLPKNNLLGSDAGIWAGVKTEALQAMESLSVEVNYLNGQAQKGAKDIDTADMIEYYDACLVKTQEFLALFGNKIDLRFTGTAK
mmetsp:Transcript_46271/g.112654  ORF Transcript_46271/g.112654 Transcript_46271/m.112654 type:complete len:226 (+) Transcript_46271:223-900(+)